MSIILILPLFTACATEDYGKYTDASVEISNNNRAMVMTYLERKNQRDAEIVKHLSGANTQNQSIKVGNGSSYVNGGGGNDTALVLYALMSGEREERFITANMQKPLEKPKTVNDVWDTVWGSTFPTLIKWGAGMYIGHELIGALGTAKEQVTLYGDNNSYMKDTGNVFGGGGSTSGSLQYDPANSIWDNKQDITGNDGINNGYTPTEVVAPEVPVEEMPIL